MRQEFLRVKGLTVLFHRELQDVPSVGSLSRICDISSVNPAIGESYVYKLSVAEKKVTGPASYFPSIEKKYGKPIEYWMKELKKVSKLAHMEQVAHLKEKFEMGHGHANALVAVFRSKNP
jgi:hypothetical protein